MGNVAYFVLGNVWLLAALALWLGRNFYRADPVRYSFFGVGGPHSPLAYQAMIVVCVVIGAALVIRSRRRPRTEE